MMTLLKALIIISSIGGVLTLLFILLVAYYFIESAVKNAKEERQWRQFIENKRIKEVDYADRSEGKGSKEH